MCLSSILSSSAERSRSTAGKAALAAPVSQAPCQQYHLLDGSLLGKGWQDVASDHGVQGSLPCLPVDTKGSQYKEGLWRSGSVALSHLNPLVRGLAEAAWMSKAGSASAETTPGNFRLEKYFYLLSSFGSWVLSSFSARETSLETSHVVQEDVRPKWCQKAGDLLEGQFGGLPLPEHQSSMYGQVCFCCWHTKSQIRSLILRLLGFPYMFVVLQ